MEYAQLTPEDAERFCLQAKGADPEHIMRAMDLFMYMEGNVRLLSRPRTLLELQAIRACQPEHEEESSLSERLDKMEKLLASGRLVAAQGEKPKVSGEKPAPVAKAPEVKPADKPEAPEAFAKALELIRTQISSVARFTNELKFAGKQGKELRLCLPKEIGIGLNLLKSKKKELERIFSESFGEELVVHLAYEAEQPPPPEKKGMDEMTRRAVEEFFGMPIERED